MDGVKKVEKPQHNTAPKGRTKSAGNMAKLIYKNYDGTFKAKDIEKLSQLYREWADEEDSLILGKFQHLIDKDDGTFSQMRDTFPVFEKAHQYARRAIAHRREELLYMGAYQGKAIMHIQYQYSEDWDKADKRNSDLSKKDSTTTDNKLTIEIDDCRSKKEEPCK